MRIVTKVFPELNPSIHIIIGYLYDIRKFLKTATNFKPEKDKNKMTALLTRQYHGIEKALTLANPRLGFGKVLVQSLVTNTRIYFMRFGYDELVGTVLNTLDAYVIFNKNNNEISYLETKGQIIKLQEQVNEPEKATNTDSGGYRIMTKQDWLLNLNNFNFKQFSESRMSIRDFSDEDVNVNLINDAVLMAMKSPSACNRQPWKVRIYKELDKNHILKYQNGNRGFTESINTVLLITGLTSSFSYSERHAAWVDGGLFSMSLIYSLHSLGLGVCALNTSYTFFSERALRKAIKLPMDEEPIMMLAVGHLKEIFSVTKSQRKPLVEVLILD